MTALCGGNPSALRPGVAGQNIIGAGILTEGLTLISPFLLPLALLIDAFLYDATSSCTADPPPRQVFTQADLTNCIGGALNPNCSATLDKVKAVVMRHLWFQYCACTGVATPAEDAPEQPAGVSTPLPSPSSGCFTGSFAGIPTEETTPTTLRPSNYSLMPSGAHSIHAFGAGQTSQTVAVPVGLYQSVRITGTVFWPLGATQNFAVEANCFDASGTFISNPFATLVANPGNNDQVDWTIALPALTAFVGLEVAQVNEASPVTVALTAVWSCPAAPAGGISVPCPPDPSVALLLQQIYTLVKLLQRQLVPFGSIDGTVHAGLSGSGSFAVQGLLGLRWHLTTVPGSVQQDGSVPPFIFNGGWVSLSTADGFIDETRVHATSQEWLPRVAAASDATLVGYEFAPGIVATITEVLREP